MNHTRDCIIHWSHKECDCSAERDRLVHIALDKMEAVVKAAKAVEASCSIGPDGCVVDVEAMFALADALATLGAI